MCINVCIYIVLDIVLVGCECFMNVLYGCVIILIIFRYIETACTCYTDIEICSDSFFYLHYILGFYLCI